MCKTVKRLRISEYAVRQARALAASLAFGIVVASQACVPVLSLAAATTCDTGSYTGFFLGGPDGKSTYAITQNSMTWDAARTYAGTSGGRLVVIANQQLNDALAHNLSSSFVPAPAPASGSMAWIGLYDPVNTDVRCMEGNTCTPMPQRFSWAGGFSGFTNYSSGQPIDLCTNAEIATNPDHYCYGQPWITMDAAGKWSAVGNHGTMPLTLPGIVEWPGTTLDCVSLASPGQQPPVVPLPVNGDGSLWCTDSSKGNLMQCLFSTTPGQQLCPLEKVACNTVFEQPVCPAGSKLDTTRHTCSADPVINCPTVYALNASGSGCERALPQCPGGGVFDEVLNKCSTVAQCAFGSFNPTTGMCETGGQVTCPVGTAYVSPPVGKCEAVPICDQGLFIPALNGCSNGQQTCPLTDPSGTPYPCLQIQGDTTQVAPGLPMEYCSPNKCQSDTQGMTSSDDSNGGQNDKTNNGPTDTKTGACLGQIYLFNGTDSRCRLYDDWGMLNAYAKLVASIVLCATGAGAALAAAMQVTGTVAAAVINAAVSIATNATIDVATGRFNGINTLIDAGSSLLMAGAGGLNLGPELSQGFNNMAGALGSSVLTDSQQQAFKTFLQQVGSISNQYSPAIKQSMIGNFSAQHCCFPDQLTGGCLSNEISEASLAGNGACHIVGGYCSSKMLFVCMTEKQTSCCFNSMLARIIQEQGRPYLSAFGPTGGWGDPKSPNCRGFTPEEFQSIPLGSLDYTEYITSINAQIQQTLPMLQNYMNRMGTVTGQQLLNSPNVPTGAQ